MAVTRLPRARGHRWRTLVQFRFVLNVGGQQERPEAVERVAKDVTVGAAVVARTRENHASHDGDLVTLEFSVLRFLVVEGRWWPGNGGVAMRAVSGDSGYPR